ncbi:MAG: hypothetical protein GY788_03240 [bacterium]|nr:hypothetical protein [bacterium]
MILTKQRTYAGRFHSGETNDLLVAGNIALPGEDSRDLLAAVAQRLREAARHRSDERSADQLAEDFVDLVESGAASLGTPALTGLARAGRSVGSCAAVAAPSPGAMMGTLKRDLERFYRQNMGVGLNLDLLGDPGGAVVTLNDHASTLRVGADCERYVGNIAHVHWSHPRVIDFIRLKAATPGLRHFNLSVDIDRLLLEAYHSSADVALRDGSRIKAAQIFREIFEAAHACGDPGVVMLDRYSRGNPIARHEGFATVAPCAEIGMAPGDTCVIGYINLGAALTQSGSVDHKRLASASTTMTRVLDCVVDINAANCVTPAAGERTSAYRRIALGVCGLADALTLLGLKYGTDESVGVLREMLARVTYSAKLESARLAAELGSYPLYDRVHTLSEGSALDRIRRAAAGTAVLDAEWDQLCSLVQEVGLRNSSVTAVPPSGRTSLLLGASAGIEPHLESRAQSNCGMVQSLGCLSDGAGAAMPSATEVSVRDHVKVAAAASGLVDEAVSKTVNLPESATVEDVELAFTEGIWRNLSAVSVYRSNSIAV